MFAFIISVIFLSILIRSSSYSCLKHYYNVNIYVEIVLIVLAIYIIFLLNLY